MPASLEHASLLLDRARADLTAAGNALAAGPGQASARQYAHHAGELSLKALLALSGEAAPPEQDLGALLRLVLPRHPAAAELQDATAALALVTPVECDEDAAACSLGASEEAVDAAQSLVGFAQAILDAHECDLGPDIGR
jgi:HEPN domain-containing protein